MTIQSGLWFDPTKLLIGGEWRPGAGGRTIAGENPSTGENIGQIAEGTAADVEAAVAAAEAALDGEWGAMTATERGRILVRLSRLVTERA
ncbi:MAG: aldehyde dehydrogenase family protein, partial [Aurantimonas coralicida]